MCDNNYTVYRHVAPNGKMYVGVTRLQPEQRWQKGNGYATNKYFSRAIKKYGWDNFKHEILLEGLTKEDASLAEQIFISYWDLTNANKGYNLEVGGYNGYAMTDAQKKKISNSLKGRFVGEKNPMYGKHLTPEQKKVISEANKNKIVSDETRRKMSEAQRGEKHPMYGKHHTEEAKRKISIANSGERNCNYGKCRCGEDNPMYGRNHTTESKRKMSEARNKEKHPVVAIDKETGKICFVCLSIRDAERWTGIAHQHIIDCCRGRAKTAGGYMWKYADNKK